MAALESNLKMIIRLIREMPLKEGESRAKSLGNQSKCVETIYLISYLVYPRDNEIVHLSGNRKFCTEEVASSSLVDPAQYYLQHLGCLVFGVL